MRSLHPSVGLVPDEELAAVYGLPTGRVLRVNFVTSLDGAVAVDGRSGGLGSDGDLRVFRVLRALADAVLVGAGTAAAEGYRPLSADSPVGRLRSDLGRPATAPVVVVSRRASLSPDDQLAGAAQPTVLVTCAAADPERRAALTAAGVHVLVCGEDDVDLPEALDQLAARGLEQVLCEGGPALFAAALDAGVVDELCLTIAPALVGGGPQLLGGTALAEVARPELVHVLTEDGSLFTRYRLA
ncbi:deaminase [Modestobacter sp. I12A-02628]|uniref:Deaminase n=1 Tax=Goekera deserti TaxID=2497753 RepID=A0A7K3WEV8_9ACTN|nr:dihydrofolate reductase family protein [Goekera deserti]MPQ96795.1 deaminase [Goekera deserti]NDI46891.1 deaminase [Goekera deserti]NEL54459.1 deaminase [Goekera deserti]